MSVKLNGIPVMAESARLLNAKLVAGAGATVMVGRNGCTHGGYVRCHDGLGARGFESGKEKTKARSQCRVRRQHRLRIGAT